MIYINIVNYEDNLYPMHLREILKPPQKLYVIGNIELLSQTNIAIVGTRHPSAYGIRNCKKFTKLVLSLGVNIVSGMAIGIDSIAHKSCIDNIGKTIAVLPCGFNNIYPKENKELFNRIVDSGGLVVSEYAPDASVSYEKFVNRNRIVAGLSMCTIIIEAAHRSGTSITAGMALKQGKKVFCIPGNIENKYSVGTNELIKKGANLLTSIDDIISEYPFFENSKSEMPVANVKSEFIDVYSQITEVAISVDELVKKLNMEICELNYKLTMLEMDGFIIELPGGNYIRNEC